MIDDHRPSWDASSDSLARCTTALLDASGRVPEHEVDWEVFHTRLNARAQLVLVRLRHPHLAYVRPEAARRDRREDVAPLAWWEHAARWSRAIVTASVAAGIALVMIVRASPKETPETVVTAIVAAADAATDAPRAAFESAVIGHSSASSMSAALLPTATDLLIPLGGGGQTR